MRTPLVSPLAFALVVVVDGSGPWIRWAPEERAVEMRDSTRVLEAVLTRVGGGWGDWGDVGVVVRADFRAWMKGSAIEEWMRIRSVAMQIWPDC